MVPEWGRSRSSENGALRCDGGVWRKRSDLVRIPAGGSSSPAVQALRVETSVLLRIPEGER